MDRRPLGNTGAMVSPIGFGGFKIGRNTGTKYAEGYALPSDDEVATLLNGVLDLGINLIDTAPAYGTSEERIGKAIGERRGEYLLSTKVGEIFEDGVSRFDFSAAGVKESLARSCERLRTDHLDLVLVHSNGEDLKVLQETAVVEALFEAKEKGITQWIGFSGKTIEGARAALNWADVLMVEYHREDDSHGAVMEEAREQGVGILVKKGLASGRIPGEEGVLFGLKHPAVSSMVIGGLNLKHVRGNVAKAADLTP